MRRIDAPDGAGPPQVNETAPEERDQHCPRVGEVPDVAIRVCSQKAVHCNLEDRNRQQQKVVDGLVERLSVVARASLDALTLSHDKIW